MAARLTTKTWTRAEWNEAQTKGTEGGFVADAIQRTSYEEYLKNAGFKSEAEAMAQRAKEDEEGIKFGEVKSADEIKQLSERKGTPEYLAELDAAGAKTREEESKRIALLSKGYITGKEPVYIWGTPENKAFMEASNATAMATGTQPEVPDAYLDAQAFAARYDLYNRYGATTPNYTYWDDAKKQYVEAANPYYNPEVLVPKVGMGNQWYKLERAKWASVVPGVGSTAATSDAQLAIESFFSKTVGAPAGNRFFMRTPGDIVAGTPTPAGTTTKTVVSTTKDANGNTITQYSDGTSSTVKQSLADTTTAATMNERMSVYSTMAERFNRYGLNSLANKIKELAIKGATEATITLELQDTPEYQQRFSANAERIKKGLSVLTPSEYVNTEDAYRQVLRAYGLKDFDNDTYVKQFISNDVSATELSNRVVTAVQRVQNADPAISRQLRDFYGIGQSDLVAYVLDPNQQFQKIQRQVAAAEIGVAAGRQGLQAGVSVAEQLAAQGVTQAEAQKGYATIADILPTAEKLSDIYGTTLDEYRQAEGEQEVFNSLASAQRKRQKLTAREIAAFSGSSGTNRTSLTTSNVGQF